MEVWSSGYTQDFIRQDHSQNEFKSNFVSILYLSNRDHILSEELVLFVETSVNRKNTKTLQINPSLL